MANLAAAIDQAVTERARSGGPGLPVGRTLADGDGWRVSDVVCAAGPRDRPFEERHQTFAIAVVAAGSFEYRADGGTELMTPGSLMLGTAGQCFECGHAHGAGDRCVSFQYQPSYFERIAADAGAIGALAFRQRRMPPVRPLASLVARACAGASGAAGVDWEELALRLAAATLQATGALQSRSPIPSAAAFKRVSGIVRRIERHPDERLSLGDMAQAARLSPFHFLRVFEQVTATTPHQFVIRARLREAARRLLTDSATMIDIGLDCGFSDPSRFSHAFRAEFGISPRIFRHRYARLPVARLRLGSLARAR